MQKKLNRPNLEGLCVCCTVLIAVVACLLAVQSNWENVPQGQFSVRSAISNHRLGLVRDPGLSAVLDRAEDTQISSLPQVEKVSVLLTHGRGDDALALLCELEREEEREEECKVWSDGRFCWYKSLACRLTGDHVAASHWKDEAVRLGIPELGEGVFSFWDQQEHWSCDLSFELVELDKTKNRMRYVSLISEADSIAYTAKQMVDEIRKERLNSAGDAETSEHILTLVRLATWELLLGEYTSFHDSLALWTTSVDSFVDGKQLLQQIESEIELNPELEKVVSSIPEVAIRLDSARVRLVAIENKEAISRQEEVARLHQLRQIAKQYRSMADSMLKWQSYFTLADIRKSNDAASQSAKFLQDVQDTVNQRSGDFHLFDDEPPIDGDSEFGILAIKPVPLSAEPLAQLKATRGYGLYLAALSEEDSNRASELLLDSEKWAMAALDDVNNFDGLPEGSDENNLMGKLTLGLVALEKSHALSLSPEMSQREDATRGYQAASTQFMDLRNLLEGLGYGDTDSIPEAIANSLDLLSGPERSAENSIQLFLSGELDQAREELLLATKVHRTGATALDSISIGIHAGLPTEDLRKEWNQYRMAEVFSDGDVAAMLAQTQISCLAAGRAVTGKFETDLPSLLNELRENSEILRDAANDQQVPDEVRNAVKANLSLTQAYRWLLSLESDEDLAALSEDEIKEAYRHGRDAEFYFQNDIGAEVETISSFAELRSRDALVASRLALGHLAAMHLDDWRDESRIFLAAAVQEAAKLPRVDPVLPLLGEPLLKQFFSDANNRDQKLAAEERQRRQMVTRCLEALFVLRFGSPSEGAKQMTKAVDIGQVSADLGREVNAAELSAAADGFDAKLSLPDTVKAFEVLSLLEAGQSEIAFGKAIALASGGLVSVDDFEGRSMEQASRCLGSIESPLVAFVFAAAIEAELAACPIAEDLDGRVWLAERALAALNRGSSMLEEMRLADRYPHIQTLIVSRISEFTDAGSFIALVERQVEMGELENAEAKAREGLSKHAKNSELWDLYLRSRILASNSRGASEDKQLTGLVSEIRAAKSQGLVEKYSAAELLATALERLGRYEEAAENYSRAAEEAELDIDRIRASANAERLRVGVMAAAG